MDFLRFVSEQPTVQPEIVFSLGTFGITNAMITGLLVTLILTVLSVMVFKRLALVPGKFQTAVEIAVSAFYDLIEQITGRRDTAEKLLPLIGTLFLFIGVSNIIGLIPGLTSITYGGVPMFRTATNDFNMTFSIALAMVVLAQVASLQEFGILGHLAKYFKFKDVLIGFKQGIGAGALAIVDFLIGLLDIVSEVAKVVSLSLRLFGNMFAGDVLAAILLGTFGLLIPAPWVAMNLLVGLLQAMVFGSLTAAYYALAIERVEETA